jgi:hypothetical protein
MNLLVNLKQFLTASVAFAIVMTIHLSLSSSMGSSSNSIVKKDYQQEKLILSQLALHDSSQHVAEVLAK